MSHFKHELTDHSAHRHDIAQQQTLALPRLKFKVQGPGTLPETPTLLLPKMEKQPAKTRPPEPQSTPLPISMPDGENGHQAPPPLPRKSGYRLMAIGLLIILIICLYFLWRPATTTSPPSTTGNVQLTVVNTTIQSTPVTRATTTTGATTLQAYILGAVKRPGVYTLSGDARIHHLLDAAGGPLAEANLVLINLAAHLSDGQEVYVPRVGERTPMTGNTSTGSSTATATDNNGELVNINTATADELREKLNVSSQTAQKIIAYREQHGSYTAIDVLQQVVSKTIYTKIKDKVTV